MMNKNSIAWKTLAEVFACSAPITISLIFHVSRNTESRLCRRRCVDWIIPAIMKNYFVFCFFTLHMSFTNAARDAKNSNIAYLVGARINGVMLWIFFRSIRKYVSWSVYPKICSYLCKAEYINTDGRWKLKGNLSELNHVKSLSV